MIIKTSLSVQTVKSKHSAVAQSNSNSSGNTYFENLKNLINNNKVTLKWTPEHKDFEVNKEADALRRYN